MADSRRALAIWAPRRHQGALSPLWRRVGARVGELSNSRASDLRLRLEKQGRKLDQVTQAIAVCGVAEFGAKVIVEPAATNQERDVRVK